MEWFQPAAGGRQPRRPSNVKGIAPPGDNRTQQGCRTRLFFRFLAATSAHRYAPKSNLFLAVLHSHSFSLSRGAASIASIFFSVGLFTARLTRRTSNSFCPSRAASSSVASGLSHFSGSSRTTGMRS